MSTALVTGPTSGIGEAFARRLASDGYDLVLVARDAERLAALATEFTGLGINAEVMVVDLGDRADLARVESRLADDERPVEVLVNNAGFALNQDFIGGSVDREQAAIDVMVTAVMRLTHAVLPGMRSRRGGLVINVSSIASFLPFGTYSAAKSWVTSFSQGVASELMGTPVQVIAVCPGLVRTQFHARAGMDMTKTGAWMWLSTEQVVEQAFVDARRGKVISVTGSQYRALAAGTHLIPRDVVRRLQRFRRHRVGSEELLDD